jgi:hypothetical protein
MPISAAPLLLIGAAYLAFQLLIYAKPLDFFKALIVSSAFILWGIDQLLPSGWFATTLGDIVIVLYVIDLGWMMMDRLKQEWKSHHTQPEKTAFVSNLPPSKERVDTSWPHTYSGLQPVKTQYFVELPKLPKRNAPFLRRKRLIPLPCTCTSPLAPLQSSMCCRSMEESTHPS